MSAKTGVAPANVLIVDDHAFLRRGLAQIIEDLPEVVVCGEAAGVAETLEQIGNCHPDIVVVDISLADGNGLELTKEIKSTWPDIKVLVSSMHDEALFAERALRAGALGYVSKSDNVDAFIAALRRVCQGQVYLSPRMTNRLLTRVVAGGSEPSRSPLETLSDRELEVFELIGRGMSTKQIAGHLDISRKTVETYREHIKSKLNLRNGTELTRHAVQWVLERSGTEVTAEVS
ncbi:MAG: response regulator transcription factor [Planctomycetaceae bacterium]|nr:response regulator transcription factor [Planctomycetaceae bacterium]